MKQGTKWLIVAAVALIAFILLLFYSSEVYVWLMGKFTTLLIWIVIFVAGWVLGRYGNRLRTTSDVEKSTKR